MLHLIWFAHLFETWTKGIQGGRRGELVTLFTGFIFFLSQSEDFKKTWMILSHIISDYRKNMMELEMIQLKRWEDMSLCRCNSCCFYWSVGGVKLLLKRACIEKTKHLDHAQRKWWRCFCIGKWKCTCHSHEIKNNCHMWQLEYSLHKQFSLRITVRYNRQH